MAGAPPTINEEQLSFPLPQLFGGEGGGEGVPERNFSGEDQ